MKKIAIQVIMVLLCGFLHAQQAFTNSGNMQIHSGAYVSGSGNFTNTSSGVLVNYGNLYIIGNITNDQSSMAIGTGTLYLNGTSGQSMNGSQQFKTYHLNTNNSAGITLNNNLSVSGVHTFTNGVIATSATPNYLIYEAGSSYTGDGDARHVNGWVKKIGASDFIFPVGNATAERTVALNNLSGSSEFNVRYAAPTPNYSQYQIPLWNIDPNEYWIIYKISGGSATVTMNWDYSKIFFPNWIVADIRTASYNGSNWTDAGGTASGNVATIGNITSGTFASFNYFTFGSRSFPIPLRLISFTAKRITDYTQLAWITTNEQSVDHFIMERSDDGAAFYAIGHIPARNTGVTEYYSGRDNGSINHVAYYRLRWVDVDGHEELSKTVLVTVAADTQLTLLTNPVHGKVTLIASASLNGLFNYTIMAMNGQLAQQGKLRIQNGGLYPLELKGNLKPGMYTLHITNNLESFNYKLSVQ